MATVLPFDHAESRRRRDHSARAQAGRKLIREEWRPVIDEMIWDKKFLRADQWFADALTAFPSSTTSGYLWASQTTLAEKMGASVSTVERCVRRFKNAGLLEVRRRGTGRSAIYILCVEGEPLFPNSKRQESKRKTRPDPSRLTVQDPSRMTDQTPPDPSRMTDKSCKSTDSCKAESEQRPPPPPEYAARPQGRPTKRATVQAAYNSIVDRLGDGDVAQGWTLFGALDDLDRSHLERLERDGIGIDDALLNEYRLAAVRRLGKAGAS